MNLIWIIPAEGGALLFYPFSGDAHSPTRSRNRDFRLIPEKQIGVMENWSVSVLNPQLLQHEELIPIISHPLLQIQYTDIQIRSVLRVSEWFNLSAWVCTM